MRPPGTSIVYTRRMRTTTPRIDPKKIPPARLLGFLLGCLLVTVVAGTAAGEQWPQWGGPDHNFSVPARDLATSWPDDGPPRAWSQRLGPGHSGIVVAGDTLYTLYRDGQKEVLVAHHAANGGLKWRHQQPAKLWGGFDRQYGSGPHSTPAVRDGRVCAVSVRAVVLCLGAGTGELLWSYDLWQKHDAEPSDRGYASSPLAYGELIIVAAAGRGLVALDAGSGDPRWTRFELPNNAFSSPIIARVGDRDQVVYFAAKEVVGVDPGDGRVLWRHTHRTNYDVNAMTPMVSDDGLLFVSSAYDAGSRSLQLAAGGDGVSELWFNHKIKVHHQSVVRLGDTIVGSSGDFGPAFVIGVDARTGEIRFKDRGFAKANLLRVGEQILILDEDGLLALASLGAGGLEVQAKAQVLSSRSWAVPALAGTTLYVRDQKEMVALDLAPPGP